MSDQVARVLVVSTAVDEATDAVVAELGARGASVCRLNTEEFPFADGLALSVDQAGPAARLRFGESTERITSCTSCWYRRVRIPARPVGMDVGIYDFSIREARAALLGLILSLPAPTMNDPARTWVAEVKPRQLAGALRCGLQIPPTLITNDPAEVRSAFSAWGGRMIAKPVRSGYVEQGGIGHAIFTNAVVAQDLEDDAALRSAPVIYQPLLPKRCDLRVTVVGQKVFAAEIHSQEDPAARIDWRRTADPHLPHERATLPPGLEGALLRLCADLGLRFAAIDLVHTVSDEYVFLEVNPGGQWLWIEDLLEYPITATIAEWLLHPSGLDGSP